MQPYTDQRRFEEGERRFEAQLSSVGYNDAEDMVMTATTGIAGENNRTVW